MGDAGILFGEVNSEITVIPLVMRCDRAGNQAYRATLTYREQGSTETKRSYGKGATAEEATADAMRNAQPEPLPF